MLKHNQTSPVRTACTGFFSPIRLRRKDAITIQRLKSSHSGGRPHGGLTMLNRGYLSDREGTPG